MSSVCNKEREIKAADQVRDTWKVNSISSPDLHILYRDLAEALGLISDLELHNRQAAGLRL